MVQKLCSVHILLLLSVHLLTSNTFTAPDPCCSVGISYKNVCCASSCNECGGDECDGYPGGETNCCPDKILTDSYSCNDVGPPCIITKHCVSTDVLNERLPLEDTPDTGVTGPDGNGDDTGNDEQSIGYFQSSLPRLVLIELTGCIGWKYGSISNSLQIQMKGQYDSSRFVFINSYTTLPTNGFSQIFPVYLNYFDIYGSLFSIVLNTDDRYGYCVQGISLYFPDENIDLSRFQNNTLNRFKRTNATNGFNTTLGILGRYDFYFDYLGMGVILSKKCRYTYRSLTTHRSLIRCFDDYFELFTQFTIRLPMRGIYKTVMHTCITPKSGITALNMTEGFGGIYGVLMGKIYSDNTEHSQNVYFSTDIEYLDHVQVGVIDLDQLGHIIAGNVMIDKYANGHAGYEYAFYSRNVKGRIIGLKLEAVGYTPDNNFYFHQQDMQYFQIKINGYDAYIHSVAVLGLGQYLVAFLVDKDRIFVTESTQFIIYGTFTNHLYLNIFVIFEGFNDKYKLPFIVEEYSYNDTNDNEEQHYETTQGYAEPNTYQPNATLYNAQNDKSGEKYQNPITLQDKYDRYDKFGNDFGKNEEIVYNNGDENGKQIPWYVHPMDDKTYNDDSLHRPSNGKSKDRPHETQTENAKNTIEKEEMHDGKHRHKGIDWFEANRNCKEKYGTFLTSIHSSDEHFLINGFIGTQDRAWIGYVDWDINSVYNDDGNGCNNRNMNNLWAYNCDWKWIDGSFKDYIDWAIHSPNHITGNDCAYIEGQYRRGWENTFCDRRDFIKKYVCLSGKWYPNHKRKWEINVDEYFNEIALISVGNDNEEDALCINSLSVNYDVPVEYSVQWIGGGSIDSHLNALFKAPVCKTTILNLKPDYPTQISLVQSPGARIPNSFCRNEGRMPEQDIWCKIDQIYALGARTVFRLGKTINGGIFSERLKHISMSSASSVTISTQQERSIITSNELMMDQFYRILYVDNTGNGTTDIDVPIHVDPSNINQADIKPLFLAPVTQWFDIERNIDAVEDDVDIDFNLQQWETFTAGELRCRGRALIPAAHMLPYTVLFNMLFMQIKVKVDVKLTLCPEFINSQLYNQDSHFVYVNNVDAQVLHTEPTTCMISWAPSVYINNTISCAEEQKIAITVPQDGYLPLCRKTNSKEYDGCQCNLSTNVCWCASPSGNPFEGQVSRIPDSLSWQEVCVDRLNCSNSDITV